VFNCSNLSCQNLINIASVLFSNTSLTELHFARLYRKLQISFLSQNFLNCIYQYLFYTNPLNSYVIKKKVTSKFVTLHEIYVFM